MNYSNKFYWICLLLMATTSISFAQQSGKFEFDVVDYDFGDIQEVDGPALYEFEFTNIGTSPIIISRVKASCGCTTPGWSKEPVAVGGKGFIKVQYNPGNRPGNFRKSLTITSNADPVTTRLYIKGKVIPRVKTIEEKLPVKTGQLRTRSNAFNLGRMTTEKVVEKSFSVYNDGDTVVTFLDKYDGPDFISLRFEPQTLAAKQEGVMIVVYNPLHDDSMGLNNHGINYFTSEPVMSKKKLNVMATITEYFAPMTDEELAKAPVLQVADRLQNIGKVDSGSQTTVEFVITNGGKTQLNIRKVKSNCACFVAKLDKYDIKPGKSAVLSATFDATNRRGNQNKSITIYSNDPKGPTQVVSIKASVVMKQ